MFGEMFSEPNNDVFFSSVVCPNVKFFINIYI